MSVATLILALRPDERYRAGRTARALRHCGLDPGPPVQSAHELAARLVSTAAAQWILRAGAWPARTSPWTAPPPSASGRPLCGLGAVRPCPGAEASPQEAAWRALLTATGGDLDGWTGALPDLASVYLEAALAARVGEAMRDGAQLDAAVAAAVAQARARVARIDALDVHDDDNPRVAQVVTSLQRGGAERVALELAEALPAQGVSTLLVILGAPTRGAFPTPRGALDLACQALPDRDARARALAEHLTGAFAADVVHGHLLEGEDVARVSRSGIPVVLTVHNKRPLWPAGLETLGPEHAALLVSCSLSVEKDLAGAGLKVARRTVWNGVDFSRLARTPARLAAAAAWRERLGFGGGDLLLLAVANPRPQKRLQRLASILAQTRRELARRGIAREARLVLAGEASRSSDPAAHALARFEDAVLRLGLGPHVRQVGAVDDVAPLLLAADVFVSASACEGLSLAHLEALAAGIPAVTTDAGGAAEAAWSNPAACVLPIDSDPARFAEAILERAGRSTGGGRAAASVHFTRSRMVQGYARLYPRAVVAARGKRRGDGLLLVTNNFSTGGAQSSARRLLLALHRQGVRVRAAVLQEQPAWPTPGRRDLVENGVPVLAPPAAGSRDAAATVARLLESIDADPPAAVLLWNAIAEHKLLLVDLLLDIPVWDVSPGEMYFESLERYFEHPRPGLPYLTAADYGARLAGVVVKYEGEAARAAETLGAIVHVVSNGVPESRAELGQGRPAGAPLVIGTLARIHPRKRLEDLIEALRGANGGLPPHVLRIAGGVEPGCENYADQLRRRAEGLNVEWVGEVLDPQPFLRQLDVFALVAEPAGCPNASLEAMAEGLPVVATDVGGAAEQVVDGVTGRLVPRGDAAALATALGALGRDRAARERLGAAARARVAERFSLERMVAGYRRLCLDG